jgi:hypothetical protein
MFEKPENLVLEISVSSHLASKDVNLVPLLHFVEDLQSILEETEIFRSDYYGISKFNEETLSFSVSQYWSAETEDVFYVARHFENVGKQVSLKICVAHSFCVIYRMVRTLLYSGEVTKLEPEINRGFLLNYNNCYDDSLKNEKLILDCTLIKRMYIS